MTMFDTHNPGAFTFGLLGNLVSFIVFLAPIPTFYRIWKKKSTEGFHSVPYVVSLFSAMLWIYYATMKTDVSLLITINAFGCFIETLYIALFIVYATKQARMSTLRLLILMNGGGFCSILLLSHFLAKGSNRVRVLGWVCVSFAVGVFAAPLSIVRLVIRTRSVEFMPFYLSFFLTLNAIMWFFYGFLLKDYYIAVPNVLGFIFGILQMILYVYYKNCKPLVADTKLAEDVALPDLKVDIQKLSPPPADGDDNSKTVHDKTEDHSDQTSKDDPLNKC
ncbi:hypothetical protein ACOSP7_000144 [Xanthoceras sorbifolium]|uniref:Bidirectional sugar transporter SWEET n=1 Tax=Xanthoceras sorbifolium TaxID=99658 RepID=A0ABQ8IPB9_9ROSI|nr:hypothetical protein JRO89_XS01G0396100 [Xanthoceras sorbifolium]